MQRLLVAAHLRTTDVPGQGVDGPLLYLVIDSPGPGSPPPGVFAIWLRLRQNVLGRANACVLRTTARQTPKSPKPDWAPRDATPGIKRVVNPDVFCGSTVLCPTADDPHAHRAGFCYGVTALRACAISATACSSATALKSLLRSVDRAAIESLFKPNTLRLHTGEKNAWSQTSTTATRGSHRMVTERLFGTITTRSP